MALIRCPECSKEVSEVAENCPHCGYPIQKMRRKERSGGTTLYLIIAVCVFAFGILCMTLVLSNTQLKPEESMEDRVKSAARVQVYQSMRDYPFNGIQDVETTQARKVEEGTNESTETWEVYGTFTILDEYNSPYSATYHGEVWYYSSSDDVVCNPYSLEFGIPEDLLARYVN